MADKVVLAQLRARLKQAERQIDAELQCLMAGDPGLARRFQTLTSVPGTGRVAAAAMIVEMPGLGSMNGKEAASLAGLAPIPRESGVWKGKSRIVGGRHQLRRAPYVPALVTIRHNSQVGQVHQTLCSAG